MTAFGVKRNLCDFVADGGSRMSLCVSFVLFISSEILLTPKYFPIHEFFSFAYSEKPVALQADFFIRERYLIALRENLLYNVPRL
jgi:hypothetical protein